MKSIMKWIAGIFLAFSLILSFFTPFEKLIIIIIIKVAIKIGIIGNIINTNNETI